MSSMWRTVDRRLVRDVSALALAVTFVGVSFGAIALAAGMPAWAVITMSVIVFAGGSQFMAVGILAAGSPVAAILAGLLLNARHLPFGLAVADLLGGGWGRRLIGSHLLIDESVAFALAQPDRPRRVAAYWLTGIALFIAFVLGTVAGVAVGAAVGDPTDYGLDAAFPAGMVALLLPQLRAAPALRVALTGGVVALVTSPFLPAGLPILVALLGLLAVGRKPPAPARPALVVAEESR